MNNGIEMNEIDREETKQRVLDIEQKFLSNILSLLNLEENDQDVTKIYKILKEHNQSLAAQNFKKFHKNVFKNTSLDQERNERLLDAFSKALDKLIAIIKEKLEQDKLKEQLEQDKLKEQLEQDKFESLPIRYSVYFTVFTDKKNKQLIKTLTKESLDIVNASFSNDIIINGYLISDRGKILISVYVHQNPPQDRRRIFDFHVVTDLYFIVVNLGHEYKNNSKKFFESNVLENYLNMFYPLIENGKNRVILLGILEPGKEQKVCSNKLKAFAEQHDIAYRELNPLNQENARQFFQEAMAIVQQKRNEVISQYCDLRESISLC